MRLNLIKRGCVVIPRRTYPLNSRENLSYLTRGGRTGVGLSPASTRTTDRL